MALYTIGDTHLALGCDKPMDVFTGWEGYVKRLQDNWERHVDAKDTVVLAGDISWAMKLENTFEDFSFLNGLPGQKIILKGNHDLWWETISKMERYLDENNFSTLHFLHNNFYLIEGVAVCGTRGWMAENPQGHDAKMMNRESLRLRASLEKAKREAPQAERWVFLHYPPFYSGVQAQDIVDVMKEFSVKKCYYGHLHSAAIRWATKGNVDGIDYRLISADHLLFNPLLIEG